MSEKSTPLKSIIPKVLRMRYQTVLQINYKSSKYEEHAILFWRIDGDNFMVYDQNNDPHFCLPFMAELRSLGKVISYGQKKYPDGWDKPNSCFKYASALSNFFRANGFIPDGGLDQCFYRKSR